jgi:hypothetical protein
MVSQLPIKFTSTQLFDPIAVVSFQYLNSEIERTIELMQADNGVSLLQISIDALTTNLHQSHHFDSITETFQTAQTFALKRLLFSALSYSLDGLSHEPSLLERIQSVVTRSIRAPPPMVSSGLFALQIDHILDSVDLVNCQILALLEHSHAGGICAAYGLQILPSLLTSFPRLTRLLLWNCVSNILSSCHQISSVDYSLVEGIVSSILRSGEKQLSESPGEVQRVTSKLHQIQSINFTGYWFMDAVSITPLPSHLHQFMSFSFVSESPISGISEGIHPDWMFHCLKGLRGKSLSRWIQVLSQTHVWNDSGKMMYWLCRLAVSDVSQEKRGGGGVALDEIDEDPLSYSRLEYANLMKSALESLWKDSIVKMRIHGIHSLAFEDYRKSFCTEAGMSSDSGTMPLSHQTGSNLRLWETMTTTGSEKLTKVASTGLHDLVGRLIEATSTQSHHQDVHSLSLIPLLIPGLLPWNERIRVWNDLGSQLRMLHLLEHQEVMSRYLVMFLLPGMDSLSLSLSQKDNGALERAMLQSLFSLRNYQEDRSLFIVSIALYSLSRYLFSDILSSSNTAPHLLLLKGSRGKLFLELVEHSSQQKNELVLTDVLKWYPLMKKTELLLRSEFVSSLTVTEISDQIKSIWNQTPECNERDQGGELNYCEVFVTRNGREESIDSLMRELQTR